MHRTPHRCRVKYPIGCYLDTYPVAENPPDKGSKKVQPRLSPLMHLYLADIVDTAMLGKTPTQVAQRLIEEGVRAAIRDRLIKLRKPKR